MKALSTTKKTCHEYNVSLIEKTTHTVPPLKFRGQRARLPRSRGPPPLLESSGPSKELSSVEIKQLVIRNNCKINRYTGNNCMKLICFFKMNSFRQIYHFQFSTDIMGHVCSEVPKVALEKQQNSGG